MDNSSPISPFDHPASCPLCHMTLTSDNYPIVVESEAITICGDCKLLFFEDINTTPSNPTSRTTPRVRRPRYTYSSESSEDMFSRQFSTMINLARRNPPAVSDTSSRTTPTGSRFVRVISDTESEGFDSVYGESDATYEAYDSDVSVEVDSVFGADSDTDIDPMHARLLRWSSDDEEEDANDGNTLETLLARVQLQRSMESNALSREMEATMRLSISGRRHDITNPFGIIGDDQETSPFVGHSGDYLDQRSFEAFMERLAEADNSRTGPPPAAISFVNNLERVVVNNADHNGLACAICKDLLTVGNVVNRLPCLHLYHPSCIKPWLSNRNTCPLCRFEVPTDDVDYENRKQSVTSVIEEVEQQLDETDTSFEERVGEEVLNVDGVRGRGVGRWLYMAAPVVTLVGIGLALWLGNPGAIQSSGSISGLCGSSQRGGRSKRLWGLL